jgi:hypothetical protein
MMNFSHGKPSLHIDGTSRIEFFICFSHRRRNELKVVEPNSVRVTGPTWLLRNLVPCLSFLPSNPRPRQLRCHGLYEVVLGSIYQVTRSLLGEKWNAADVGDAVTQSDSGIA